MRQSCYCSESITNTLRKEYDKAFPLQKAEINFGWESQKETQEFKSKLRSSEKAKERDWDKWRREAILE